MNKLTKHNWQEPTAYLACLCFILASVLICQAENQPTAINRAGSAIIVVGIMLALSRKWDAVYEKALRFIETHNEKHFLDAINQVEREGQEKISQSHLDEIRGRFDKELHKDLNAAFGLKRRIFKLHEAGIIIAGTLINGFGDLAAIFFVSHS